MTNLIIDAGMIEAASAAFDDIAANFGKLHVEIPSIAAAATVMIAGLRRGNKILFCGNGGSAADSQHLAAELMGRYLRDRRPLPALALTVDSSALTAIGNDYGFEDIFSRQVRGVGISGDILVGISTSGNSRNVVRAFQAARDLGIATIGLTGQNGGAMVGLCDVCIQVPATATNRIQEMHIAIGHLLCGFVEEAVC